MGTCHDHYIRKPDGRIYYLCSMTHQGMDWPQDVRDLDKPISTGADYAAAVLELVEADESGRYGKLYGDWPWIPRWSPETTSIRYVWDEATAQLCEWRRGDDGVASIVTMTGEVLMRDAPRLDPRAYHAGDVAIGMVWTLMERV